MFGAALQQDKEQELEGERYECPDPLFAPHRAEQLVAAWLHGSVIDARALAETDLLLYHQFLYFQAAVNEAEPIRARIAQAEAKANASHNEASEPGW